MNDYKISDCEGKVNKSENFPGLSSTRQWNKCHSQGKWQKTVHPVSLELPTLLSLVLHSTAKTHMYIFIE